MTYSTTSDPSDSWSNHYSNGETKQEPTTRVYYRRQRKLKLRDKFNINK